jgi:shikimate kinase / 3-dehydroquinate synthase
MTSSTFPPQRNIVITGFMGTGKSTIGQQLAAKLNRPFFDLDEQIEANFGKPIPQIFADEGEAAFRVAEAQLCSRFAQEKGIVISTGGGALVSPQNRHALAETGVLICLTASVDTILERISQESHRPLMPGTEDERRKRIRDLLYERRHAYAAIPHQINTSNRTPEQIVASLLTTLEAESEVPGMIRLPVTSPGGIYHICLGEGLLGETGNLLRRREFPAGPVAIITNPTVADQHSAPLCEGLERAGFSPVVCLMPDGEAHKTLHTVSELYVQLIQGGLDRRSPIIALGGGVVGDTAGFVAATYLRGVPLVQIPTTLLSMVDSSVGGKTGVDLPAGKNLIGAFKQPNLVIIDPAVISTLPGAEFRAGLAEVVKHGIISAPDLFEQLEEHGPTNLSHLVADAVQVKIDLVEIDPYEQGPRAHLNLGHTFGHAIELVSDFKVRHGEGVALGLVAATRMAAELGECNPALLTRVTNLLDRLGLPTRLAGYTADEIIAAMRHDKKRAGSTLRFIIPRRLGDVTIINDPGLEIVQRALAEILESR